MFGICNIGNIIYAIGGLKSGTAAHIIRSRPLTVDTCEQFNILTNKWIQLPITCNVPNSYSLGITADQAAKRYIFTFGGATIIYKTPNKERIQQLDTLKPNKGWRIIQIENYNKGTGMFYCLVGLGLVTDSDNTYEFLVFGG